MNITKYVVYVVTFVAIAVGASMFIHYVNGHVFWYVLAGQWAEIIASFAEKLFETR